MNKIVGDIIAGSESVGDTEDLNVNSRVAESVLAPQASDIQWEDLGNGKILLNVTGQNYIDGLSVQAGDKIIATPADGLAVKNDGSFMLLLAAQTLGQTKYPYLLGRYGAPVPLLRFNSKESQELPGYGLKYSARKQNQLTVPRPKSRLFWSLE